MSALILHGAGAFSVTPAPDAVAVRDGLLARSVACLVVKTEAEYSAAGEWLADGKRLVRDVEAARTKAKAPVLEAGKRIDAAAKEFTVKLEGEIDRIGKLILGYQQEQHRKAEEAERKAREEAARLERERLAKEAEARRIEAEAMAEAERKAREAAEAERRANADDFSAAVEAAKAQMQADAAAKAAAEAAAQAAAAASAPVVVPIAVVAPPPPKLAGLRQREVWAFDVTDAKALATARPDLVVITPRTREITAALERGENIPGISARKETRL